MRRTACSMKLCQYGSSITTPGASTNRRSQKKESKNGYSQVEQTQEYSSSKGIFLTAFTFSNGLCEAGEELMVLGQSEWSAF